MSMKLKKKLTRHESTQNLLKSSFLRSFFVTETSKVVNETSIDHSKVQKILFPNKSLYKSPNCQVFTTPQTFLFEQPVPGKCNTKLEKRFQTCLELFYL